MQKYNCVCNMVAMKLTTGGIFVYECVFAGVCVWIRTCVCVYVCEMTSFSWHNACTVINKQLAKIASQVHSYNEPSTLPVPPSLTYTLCRVSPYGWHSEGKITWWRHQMETFSMLLALCAGNSPVPGEFPAQRPVTRSFDVFFELRLNYRLSKQ